MSKYRKKPVVVEAKQWFKLGDHPEVGKTSYSDIHNEHGSLKVGDIFYTVYPNDWIITDAEGNYSIVKNDIFKATYERVREPAKGGGQAEAPKNIRDFSLPEPNDEFISAFSDKLLFKDNKPSKDLQETDNKIQSKIRKGSYISIHEKESTAGKPDNVDPDYSIATQAELDTLLNINRTPAEKEKQTKAMDETFAEAVSIDKLSVDFQGKIEDISKCSKCGKKLEIFTSGGDTTHSYIKCDCERKEDKDANK